MNNYPETFEEIINILKTLPGIGKRSAERIAFTILDWPKEKTEALAHALSELNERICPCPECGNLSSDNQPCRICSNYSRDKSQICVVENPAQIQNFELGAFYKGVYHVLGGRLSPLEGKSADDLNIESLIKRIDEHEVKELILALSSDVEGQATAIYLSELLKEKDIKISRLAQGLPAGSDLSYADSATIAVALQGRTRINAE